MNQKDRLEISKSIIEYCIKMRDHGLNHGTAGNISHRFEEGMLVTPSGMPYEKMKPEDIVYVTNDGQIEEGKIPSTEWRFHLSILQNKPECNAVIHNHAPYATMVAVTGIDYLPAIHYGVAIAGSNKVPCAKYATFGTQELNENIQKVMDGYKAVILKNHGLISTDSTLEKALAIALEIEFVCQIYIGTLGVKQVILSDADMDIVLQKFHGYGLNVKHNKF